MRRFVVALVAAGVAGSLIAVGWWLAAADTEPRGQPPQVVDLRTDHGRNPLGLENDAPRLSWRLESDDRGVTQTDLHVRVASDPAILSDDEADVWDSGPVESDTQWVDYDGPALESASRYYWQVRIRDGNGRASAWSDPAYWETGLLEADELQADWIGAPFERPPLEEGNPRWTGTPEPLAAAQTYGQTFTASAPFDRVEARLSAEGDAAVTLSLHEGGAGGPVLASNRVDVTGDEWFAVELDAPARPGEHTLVLRDPDGTVTWWTHDDDVYAGGAALVDDEPVDGDRTFRTRAADADDDQAVPLLRHAFSLPDREIARARLYVSGLGHAEVHLNGERVGDHVLDPGFTDYEDRVLYSTHEVTGFLRPGENAVGVALGSGWFGVNTPNPWRFHLAPWHGEPRLWLRLVVDYAGGDSEVVTTSADWRATDGPTRADSIYTGEVYDARLEQPGWTEPGFDDRAWQEAVVRDPPSGRLVAQPMEATKIVDIVEPIAVEEVAPRVFVFDFGRIMAGWVRLHVRGPEGTAVRIAYGHRRDGEGRVERDEELLGRPLQTDTYILRGDAQESWEPAFSLKGFRYVEIEGYPGTPGLEDVEGRTVHAAVASAGRFESSDELLTSVHENARRAIAGNLQSIYTSDMTYERHAWTGHAQLSAPAALQQFDLRRLLAKWLDDVADSQRDDGALPQLAPTGDYGYDEPSPAWDAAYVLVAWELYRHTGDERVLARHYDGFRAYLDYLTEQADGRIVRTGIGDAQAPGADGDAAPEGPALLSTAYYFHLASTLSDIAAVVGEDLDAQRYWALAEEIRAAFNAEFFDPEAAVYRTADDGELRQTSQVVPLAFGLVPDHREVAVFRNLVNDLAARDARLNTGIVGTRFLLPVLSEHGAVDLAYRVASQTEYPSWGHWIEAGVTGLLDRWDLDARSHGHHVFASVSAWLYEDLVGIAPLEPGYAQVRIRPRVPTALDSARGAIATARGTVGAAWEQDGEQLRLRVSLPPGTVGEVHVPAASRGDVEETGEPIWRNPHVTFERMERGAAVFRVQSGVYEFTAELD